MNRLKTGIACGISLPSFAPNTEQSGNSGGEHDNDFEFLNRVLESPDLHLKLRTFLNLRIEFGDESAAVNSYIEENRDDPDFRRIVDGTRELARIAEEIKKRGLSIQGVGVKIPGITPSNYGRG